MGTSTLRIGILTRNILKPTRSLYGFRCKSDGSNNGFRVFGDIDLDLWPWPWPLTYVLFLSHALRMMYWNIHAKFNLNPSCNTRWYAADTHARTHAHAHAHAHTHTPNVILIVFASARLIIQIKVILYKTMDGSPLSIWPMRIHKWEFTLQKLTCRDIY